MDGLSLSLVVCIQDVRAAAPGRRRPRPPSLRPLSTTKAQPAFDARVVLLAAHDKVGSRRRRGRRHPMSEERVRVNVQRLALNAGRPSRSASQPGSQPWLSFLGFLTAHRASPTAALGAGRRSRARRRPGCGVMRCLLDEAAWMLLPLGLSDDEALGAAAAAAARHHGR